MGLRLQMPRLLPVHPPLGTAGLTVRKAEVRHRQRQLALRRYYDDRHQLGHMPDCHDPDRNCTCGFTRTLRQYALGDRPIDGDR
jgi:hypothetical protein